MLSGPSELFHIELEKVVQNSEALFLKSGSPRANIDIWFAMSSPANNIKFRVAIEIKYFKKKNHREPNNRVDVFKDILNLENYGEHADVGVMLVFTDHAHYVNQAAYSEDTADFDFRNERSYAPNTVLTYKTQTPYVQPFSLRGQYQFNWLTINEKSFMLKLSVNTQLAVVAN